MKNSTKLSKISVLQFAYAFHKFIHNERNTEDWNNLDEEAYQAAKTGMFETKRDKDI